MNPVVLILDDDRDHLFLLQTLLKGLRRDHGPATVAFTSAAEALAWCRHGRPDLCLVDYQMPEMDGIAFIAAVRALPGFATVPIIMITGAASSEVEHRALSAGALEFLPKPLEPRLLRARVDNLLALRQALAQAPPAVAHVAAELEAVAHGGLERDEEAIIRKLAQLSRCRDQETCEHMRRVAHISRAIAQELGHSEQFCEMVYLAAPMHDIGKIGIPDRILLKPDRLDPDEWAIMKTHPRIGYEVLKDSRSPLLQMGADIAHAHHERYDGTGYPRGLAGEAIPLAGRIVALADEVDALLSERPYKQAWRLSDALELIRGKRGSHFDPQCVDALLARWREVLAILGRYREPAEGAGLPSLRPSLARSEPGA